jgi:hypothetical protein
VARQYLGSVGKTDNGIVAVTSLWAEGRCYWPLHVVPYTTSPPLAPQQAGNRSSELQWTSDSSQVRRLLSTRLDRPAPLSHATTSAGNGEQYRA